MILLKTITGSLAANVNEMTFTDNLIDANSIIEVYYNSNDVYTVETWQREHTIGIVTSDHDFPVSVKVLINNVVAFGPYDDTEVLSQLSDLDNRVYHAEDAISGLADRVRSAEDDIDALEDAVSNLNTSKQDVLTAGDNITIENNIISASGGGVDYSLDEQNTGLKWIDGNDIYQKTVDFGALPNSTLKQVNHNISNIENICKIESIMNYSGLIYGEILPPVEANKGFRLCVRQNTVDVTTNSNWSGYTAYVTIYYTKTV